MRGAFLGSGTNLSGRYIGVTKIRRGEISMQQNLRAAKVLRFPRGENSVRRIFLLRNYRSRRKLFIVFQAKRNKWISHCVLHLYLPSFDLRVEGCTIGVYAISSRYLSIIVWCNGPKWGQYQLGGILKLQKNERIFFLIWMIAKPLYLIIFKFRDWLLQRWAW